MDDAAALDARVDVLDAHAPTGDAPIRGLLRACELPSSRLPGWHDDLDLVECEGQEAQILEQPTARRQRIRGGIGHPLVMSAPGIGITQKEDRECVVDQQHIVHRMALFLAAIIARLLSRILGTPDAPRGAIRPKRGRRGPVPRRADQVGSAALVPH